MNDDKFLHSLALMESLDCRVCDYFFCDFELSAAPYETACHEMWQTYTFCLGLLCFRRLLVVQQWVCAPSMNHIEQVRDLKLQ
jgi:hypothetical protein